MKRIKEYTEEELRTLAKRLSEKAYVRETKTWAALTGDLQNKAFNIVYGALLSLRWNNASPEAIQGVLDYAEFMYNLVFPAFEGYTSLYVPLMIALNKEKGAILVDEDKLFEWFGL